MNIGSILGSISPAAGIASGQGMFGKAAPFLSPLMALMHGGGHGDGGGGQPPAVPDPSASVPQPAGPAPAQPPMGKPQGGPPVMAPPPGGLHGMAFGGQPNMQGILAGLQMMAPGQRRF